MITLNGHVAPDPVKYIDNHEHFKTDNISLAGNRQRNRRAIKKVVTLGWKMLEPSEFQTLVGILEGGQVAFSNNASAFGADFSFNALPDLPLDAGEYYGGGTYMRDLTVTLREV